MELYEQYSIHMQFKVRQSKGEEYTLARLRTFRYFAETITQFVYDIVNQYQIKLKHNWQQLSHGRYWDENYWENYECDNRLNGFIHPIFPSTLIIRI